ncbi:hypothetical protein WN943_006249 [Citrus x changshan-huyou]
MSFVRLCSEKTLKALKEKAKEPEAPEPEPEPTTEVLFLCSYEGCGKTFIDAASLRKHAHSHGERQYQCHWKVRNLGLWPRPGVFLSCKNLGNFMCMKAICIDDLSGEAKKFLDSSKLKDTFLFILEKEITYVLMKAVGDPMMLKSQAGTWRIMEFSLENCHYAKAT